jgi:hypothetical protein
MEEIPDEYDRLEAAFHDAHHSMYSTTAGFLDYDLLTSGSGSKHYCAQATVGHSNYH